MAVRAGLSLLLGRYDLDALKSVGTTLIYSTLTIGTSRLMSYLTVESINRLTLVFCEQQCWST